jgi:hypothetical protein
MTTDTRQDRTSEREIERVADAAMQRVRDLLPDPNGPFNGTAMSLASIENSLKHDIRALLARPSGAEPVAYGTRKKNSRTILYTYTLGDKPDPSELNADYELVALFASPSRASRARRTSGG